MKKMMISTLYIQFSRLFYSEIMGIMLYLNILHAGSLSNFVDWVSELIGNLFFPIF